MREDNKRCGLEQEYVKEISSDKIILTAQELRDIILKVKERAENKN